MHHFYTHRLNLFSFYLDFIFSEIDFLTLVLEFGTVKSTRILIASFFVEAISAFLSLHADTSNICDFQFTNAGIHFCSTTNMIRSYICKVDAADAKKRWAFYECTDSTK